MRKVLLILGQLADEDVAWLTQAGRVIEFRAGWPIIRQGQALTDIFFILKGWARVHAEGGPDLTRIGAGEVLGEMSMLDRRPPAVSVTSVEPITLLALDRAALGHKLQVDLGFSARFHRALALFLVDRLRNVTTQLAYGKPAATLRQDDDAELDETVLDNVHLAGIRFDMILERLGAAGRATT